MTVRSNNPRCDAWHPTLDHEQCEFDAGHHGLHRVSDPMFLYWWSETEMRREPRSDAGREPDEDVPFMEGEQ